VAERSIGVENGSTTTFVLKNTLAV